MLKVRLLPLHTGPPPLIILVGRGLTVITALPVKSDGAPELGTELLKAVIV